MKWNNVEMVDGELYFIDIKRWSANEPNEWVFAYKENTEYFTRHHVAARISDINKRVYSVYDYGFVCDNDSIIHLRKATQEDITRFDDYLDKWNYRYSLNTKRLRHV